MERRSLDFEEVRVPRWVAKGLRRAVKELDHVTRGHSEDFWGEIVLTFQASKPGPVRVNRTIK